MGNIVNFLAIIVGGTLGLIFKKFIKESYTDGIMSGIGICVIIMGIGDAIKSQNMLVLILSIALGTFLGEVLTIEERLNDFGQFMGRKLQKGSSGGNFAQGFVTTTLIYCVGAMGILGSIKIGLSGDSSTLFAKSILDGITAILFASTLGFGVLFSSVPVFVYQGLIILMAKQLEPFFTDVLITELSAVGGIMIMAIGINILNLRKIKVGNMLPALLGPVIYYGFFG